MADTGLTGAAGMRTMPQLPVAKPGGHVALMGGHLCKAAFRSGLFRQFGDDRLRMLALQRRGHVIGDRGT